MPGWRRRIRCRRQEVATMTMVSCVAVLCLYSLALTWCLAQPHLAPGEVGGTTLDGSPQHHPPSPVITARKLHFDAAAPRSSNINDGSLLSSSLLSSSSSSSSQKGGQMSAGGANSIQRHHRTLQFSRSGKDGWDNNAGGVVESVGSRTHKGVRTMRQKRTRAAESPRKADISSSAIYVEESEDSGEDGWGGTQEYRDGDSDVASGGSRRLPGAIIIGVKKAGTRALLEFLRLHPDVQAPGPEPHFFDRNYNRGLEWYKSLMPLSQEGQLTMEKTPSYFITREVPKRVQSMSRHVKLLVVVRDPVTRAISDYVQATSKREGRMKRFEDLALLDHRLGIVNTSWGAIRIGVYTKHLEKWFKYFPRRQFHFVSGEQLIANPAQVMQEVQQFLGLSPFITDKHFYLNATRGFPCLIKYPENKSKPHCLGKTKGRRHPDVDPHVIERLRDFYRPFNAKLYQMVGRDFGWS